MTLRFLRCLLGWPSWPFLSLSRFEGCRNCFGLLRNVLKCSHHNADRCTRFLAGPCSELIKELDCLRSREVLFAASWATVLRSVYPQVRWFLRRIAVKLALADSWLQLDCAFWRTSLLLDLLLRSQLFGPRQTGRTSRSLASSNHLKSTDRAMNLRFAAFSGGPAQCGVLLSAKLRLSST